MCLFVSLSIMLKPTNSLEDLVYVKRRLQSEQDQKWAPKQSQQDFPEGTLPPLAIHTMDWSSIKSHIWGKKSLHEACCVPSIPMIWVLVTLLNTLFCSLDRLKVVHLSHPSNPHFWVEWVLRPQVCLTPSHGTWPGSRVPGQSFLDNRLQDLLTSWILAQNQLKTSKVELDSLTKNLLDQRSSHLTAKFRSALGGSVEARSTLSALVLHLWRKNGKWKWMV